MHHTPASPLRKEAVLLRFLNDDDDFSELCSAVHTQMPFRFSSKVWQFVHNNNSIIVSVSPHFVGRSHCLEKHAKLRHSLQCHAFPGHWR
jgi:hypothetical protein